MALKLYQMRLNRWLTQGLKKVEVSDEHECSACDAKCLIMTKIYGERDETEEFEKIACCFCEDDI